MPWYNENYLADILCNAKYKFLTHPILHKLNKALHLLM